MGVDLVGLHVHDRGDGSDAVVRLPVAIVTERTGIRGEILFDGLDLAREDTMTLSRELRLFFPD